MNFLRNRIRDYILKSKTSKIKHSKGFVSFENIKKLIIFCDASVAENPEIANLYKLFSSYDISCTMLAYMPKMSIEDTKANFVYIRDMDISIKGDFLDNSLNSIYLCNYDVFFDLREKNNVISDYLAKRIKSRFVVGCNSELKGPDLLISTNGDIRVFKNSSIEFLKKLKKS